MLKLAPKPGCVAAALCGLPDFDAVVRLLNDAKAGLGGTLSAFEVMWPEFYDLMTTKAAGVRAPLSGRHARYVLIEFAGLRRCDRRRPLRGVSRAHAGARA